MSINRIIAQCENSIVDENASNNDLVADAKKDHLEDQNSQQEKQTAPISEIDGMLFYTIHKAQSIRCCSIFNQTALPTPPIRPTIFCAPIHKFSQNKKTPKENANSIAIDATAIDPSVRNALHVTQRGRVVLPTRFAANDDVADQPERRSGKCGARWSYSLARCHCERTLGLVDQFNWCPTCAVFVMHDFVSACRCGNAEPTSSDDDSDDNAANSATDNNAEPLRWAACDQCDAWAHAGCYTAAELESEAGFLCGYCARKRDAELAPPDNTQFECPLPLCTSGETFRTADALYAHLRAHAHDDDALRPTETFLCMLCDASYQHLRSLKKHLRQTHASVTLAPPPPPPPPAQLPPTVPRTATEQLLADGDDLLPLALPSLAADDRGCVCRTLTGSGPRSGSGTCAAALNKDLEWQLNCTFSRSLSTQAKEEGTYSTFHVPLPSPSLFARRTSTKIKLSD